VPEIMLIVDGEPVCLTAERDGEEWVVRGRTGEHRFRLTALEPGVLLLTGGDRSALVHAAGGDGRCALHMDGRTLEYEVAGSGNQPRGGARSGAEGLTAPMPGVVTQVVVREGDAVTVGQPLVIVEAMKMEHVVRASRAGVVRALRVRPGEQVESGAVVAEIGPAGPAEIPPRTAPEDPSR